MAVLCDAGTTLFRQVNRQWPNRDHASDGWLGDRSHTTGDHVPDGNGIVHAIDIDASLGGKPGYNTTPEAWKLANQLRKAMIDGDRRLSYIIAWDPAKGADFICSMNAAYRPLGTWRVYTGDSHINHIHVSFTTRADHDGRRFDLPIFSEEAVTEAEERPSLTGCSPPRFSVTKPLARTKTLQFVMSTESSGDRASDRESLCSARHGSRQPSSA
jgi:hypothetical protein